MAKYKIVQTREERNFTGWPGGYLFMSERYVLYKRAAVQLELFKRVPDQWMVISSEIDYKMSAPTEKTIEGIAKALLNAGFTISDTLEIEQEHFCDTSIGLMVRRDYLPPKKGCDLERSIRQMIPK